jgi:hypothetical protein
VIDSLDNLDRVPWAALHHARGPASDVPAQLRALLSTDPGARDWAMFELTGTVYHQGTRWPASRPVIPFLVAMIDDPATPERPQLARLLRAVALGDRGDEALPFSAPTVFADADDVTEAQEARSIAARYGTEPDWDTAAATEEAAAVHRKWDRDAYLAAQEYTTRYVRWLAGPDTDLAARAAELLAWFPMTPGALVGLIAMHPDPARWQPRASANLTLAHLPTRGPGMTESLRAQLHANPVQVRLTAAIALAYRLGEQLPPTALDVLVAARHDGLPADQDAVLPWHRSLSGFAEVALRRLGLN